MYSRALVSVSIQSGVRWLFKIKVFGLFGWGGGTLWYFIGLVLVSVISVLIFTQYSATYF